MSERLFCSITVTRNRQEGQTVTEKESVATFTTSIKNLQKREVTNSLRTTRVRSTGDSPASDKAFYFETYSCLQGIKLQTQQGFSFCMCDVQRSTLQRRRYDAKTRFHCLLLKNDFNEFVLSSPAEEDKSRDFSKSWL